MSKQLLITGGVRSGKSRFAVQQFSDENIAYIATMIDCDKETHERIESHKNNRNKNWLVIEEPKYIAKAVQQAISQNCIGIIIDCLTLLTSNIMFEMCSLDMTEKFDSRDINEILIINKIMDEIRETINLSKINNIDIVFVTNETGYSIVPENVLARNYRDILGAVNRDTATECSEVYLCVCGIPIKIK